MIWSKLPFVNKIIHVLWPAAAPAARPWPRPVVVVLCGSCIQTKGQLCKNPEIPANSHPELHKSQNIVNSISQSDPKVCLRALNKLLANHLKIIKKHTQKSSKQDTKMAPKLSPGGYPNTVPDMGTLI